MRWPITVYKQSLTEINTAVKTIQALLTPFKSREDANVADTVRGVLYYLYGQLDEMLDMARLG